MSVRVPQVRTVLNDKKEYCLRKFLCCRGDQEQLSAGRQNVFVGWEIVEQGLFAVRGILSHLNLRWAVRSGKHHLGGPIGADEKKGGVGIEKGLGL